MGQDASKTMDFLDSLLAEGHLKHLPGFSRFAITDEHIFALRGKLKSRNPDLDFTEISNHKKNTPALSYQLNQEIVSSHDRKELRKDLHRQPLYVRKTAEDGSFVAYEFVDIPEMALESFQTFRDPAQEFLKSMAGNQPEWLTEDILQPYLYYATTIEGAPNQLGEYGRLYGALQIMFQLEASDASSQGKIYDQQIDGDLLNKLSSNQDRRYLLEKDESGAVRVRVVHAFSSDVHTVMYHSVSFFLVSDGNGLYSLEFLGGEMYINDAYPQMSQRIQSQLDLSKKRAFPKLLMVLLSGFVGGFVGYFGLLPASVLGMMTSFLVAVSLPITPLFIGLLSVALVFSAFGLFVGAALLLNIMKSVSSEPVSVSVSSEKPVKVDEAPTTGERDSRVNLFTSPSALHATEAQQTMDPQNAS